MARRFLTWLTQRRRRWMGLSSVALLAVIVLVALRTGSSAGRAKRLYRESILGGTTSQQLPSELDRIETRACVEALISLLEDCHSTLQDRYGTAYAKLPPEIQRRLPVPLDRDKALPAGLELLQRFGPAAAPAVGALLRVYQNPDAKLLRHRVAVVRVLGRIGPAAAGAIPTLLISLGPTNGSIQYAIADTLIAISPSGDEIEREWERLSAQPEWAGLTAEIADWCSAALTHPVTNPATNPVISPAIITVTNPVTQAVSLAVRGPPARQPVSLNSWSALQILGLLRPEARRTVPMMTPYLDDENGVLRGQAASSLGLLQAGAREALPSLRRRFTDDWPVVRTAATNAVQAIEGDRRDQPKRLVIRRYPA